MISSSARAIPKNKTWLLLKPYIGVFLLVLHFGIFTDLLALIYPVILQRFLDAVLSGKNWRLQEWTLIVATALSVLGFGLVFLRDYFSVLLSVRVDKGFSSLVLRNILNLPLMKVRAASSGDWLVAMQHVQDVKTSLSIVGTQAIFATLLVAGYSIILWHYDFSIFCLYAAMATVSGSLLIFMSYRVYNSVDNAFAEKRLAETVFSEAIKYPVLVRAFRLSEWLHGRWARRYDQSLMELKSADILVALCTALLDWIRQTAPIFILIWKLPATGNGQISIGSVVAASFIFGQGFEPLLRISVFFTSLQKTRLGLRNLCEIAEQERMHLRDSKIIHNTTLDTLPKNGAVQFTNVTFAVEPQHRILDGIQLSICHGEKIALVGRSGSGKTTLLQIILGLLEPNSGAATIDGIAINTIPVSTLRKLVAMVSHNPVLLTGSILENIILSDTCPNQKRVNDCLKSANADEFIRRLSEGFYTIVGDGGLTLSAGETQRIALARALYVQPRILVLDEPTSALDNLSEKAFSDVLSNLAFDCTVIVAAHRLSTIKDFDRIIVMDKGCIVETGSHIQLLAQKGSYYNLWNT